MIYVCECNGVCVCVCEASNGVTRDVECFIIMLCVCVRLVSEWVKI